MQYATLLSYAIAAIALTVPGCAVMATQQTRFSQPSNPASVQQWRQMSPEEAQQAWQYVLNSPLGIAALNQLAIEGFINPNCPKAFYVNQDYEGFQTLLRVKCPTPRGVSSAIAYEEMRVIFNRFEDNVESFQVERVSSDAGTPVTPLPD